MFLDIFKTDLKFDVLYVDPPWKQTKGGRRKVRPNQSKELDYKTITLDEIKEIQNYVLQNLTNDNHVVFMWTIDKYLTQCEKMMMDLGYKMHARMIWDKGNGIAPAFTLRYSHEYLIWFYKSKFMPINQDTRGKFTTVFREKATRHSKKPICVYEFIENIYPDKNKLEMYARYERENWYSWGDELDVCRK